MGILTSSRPGPQDTAAVPGPRPAVPGEALLQPAALTALLVLVINDHGLKARWGGEPLLGRATGKLSDVAGLVFFPLLLVSLVEVVRWARAALPTRGAGDGRPPAADPGWTFTARDLVVAVAVTGVGFATVQTVPVAAEAYGQGLALLRWLPSGVAASVTGGAAPPLPSVDHTMDPTDALCLPALWCSYRIGQRILHRRGHAAGTVLTDGVGAVPPGGSGGRWSGA